jgi:hypothetical protein
MAEVYTPEIQFGRFVYGSAVDPISGLKRKTIWITLDPASLFQNAGVTIAGACYDPSDLTSMFQDTAGTVPAVVNSSVARINDKSGNGNHLLQATAANQPILKSSGSGAATLYWLEFDGVNDVLDKVIALAATFSRISALRQITWGANFYLMAGANDLIGGLSQTASSPNIGMVDTVVSPVLSTLAVGVDGVVSEVFNGASSSITLNNDAPVVGANTLNPLTNITVGGLSPPGTNNSNIRWYGSTIRVGVFTTSEIAALRLFYAQKCGAAV